MDQQQHPENGSSIVVGVVRGQPDEVLVQAAILARKFNATLICASVDMTRYTVEELPDGSVTAFPLDPDAAEVLHEEFDQELADRIQRVLEHEGVTWSLRALAGEPARELSHLAEHVDAALIVVGTRHEGFRGSVREFFSGSVAVHLAHRQHRPVVVIPLSPIPRGTNLPWEES
jgi:nucleotide-binding universal stress UspA family protein